MRIVCSGHGRERLRERFGVQWTVGLEIDLTRQVQAAPGPLGLAEMRGRGEPEGTSYWAVKIDGMSAVLVLTDKGVIRTVLRHLDAPDRPKRQKRRKRKTRGGGSGKRPSYTHEED